MTFEEVWKRLGDYKKLLTKKKIAQILFQYGMLEGMDRCIDHYIKDPSAWNYNLIDDGSEQDLRDAIGEDV